MSDPSIPVIYHEKTPSTPSVKSSLSVPLRDTGQPRRVDFQKPRPKLKIPTPQTPYGPKSATLSVLSGIPSAHLSQKSSYYGRKQSGFMFNNLRDFTKSGLDVGEKSAWWLYTKLRTWSRKWFTHLFLSIVLVFYTIGGALIFITVEGYNEEAIVLPNLQKERYSLIRSLREYAITVPEEKSIGEYEGLAYRRLKEFESLIIDAYSKDKLIVSNGGERKIWTFFNAVVYCSTIYTSIDFLFTEPPIKMFFSRIIRKHHKVSEYQHRELPCQTIKTQPVLFERVYLDLYILKILSLNEMDSEETSPLNNEENVNISRIEAMVTPEQVFSASVARKRRNLTKKQNPNKNREQTPVRDFTGEIDGNEETEDVQNDDERRPRTPERPCRKSKATERNGMPTNCSIKSDPSTPTTGEEGRNSVPRTFLEDLRDKTENFAELAHNELNVLLSKTKKSISSAAQRGRKFNKKKSKEETKRSQSVPYEFTEEELLASLRRKKLINGVKKSSSYRRLSDFDPQFDSSEKEVTKQKTFRPEVQAIIKKRKTNRERKKSVISNKIIEVLDPKTKNIVCTKTIIRGHVGLREFFLVLRMFRIIEIQKEFKKYKEEMKTEMGKIKVLRNKCFSELFVVVLFCGIGGFIFKFTEGAFENFYKCGVKRVKRDFIDLLWTKSHSMREDEWKSLARNRLRIFEEELHAAHEAGMTSYSGQRSWSFLNGIVYSLTVITTIGYGHIYPTTMTGRALTIVYSLIGIPLFLLALTDFGKLFTRCIKFLWSFVRRLYYTGSCRKVRKQAQVQEIFKGAQMMYDIATFRRPSAIWDQENPQTITTPGETPTTPALSNFEIDDQFNLPISVAIFILLLYIFFGAFFYGFMEGWNFFQSFYFVFISMSTIGFGDLVPNNPLCTIISIVYLVFGLALMSMCINVVQEKLSDTFKSASAKLGASLGVTVAAEDGSIITIPPESIEIPPIHDHDTTENKDYSKEEEKTNRISFEVDEGE